MNRKSFFHYSVPSQREVAFPDLTTTYRGGDDSKPMESCIPEGEVCASSIGLPEQISALQAGKGLTTEELSDLLSAHFGQPVSPSMIVGWKRGCRPRLGTHEVSAALEKVAEGATRNHPLWVSAEDVQREVKGWLEILTRKQLRIAAETSQSNVSAYEAGKVKVRYARWKKIQLKVNSWIDYLEANQKEQE